MEMQDAVRQDPPSVFVGARACCLRTALIGTLTAPFKCAPVSGVSHPERRPVDAPQVTPP